MSFSYDGSRNLNTNYEYYRIFYYAAKYGSFTKAAHVLCSNQPNVTRSMNKLEQQLGCTLFLRNRHGISLTPEGSRLYDHVGIALEQLQAGEEELAESSSLRSGIISIGASETALNIFLLNQLSRFHKKHPGIRLRISNFSTPQAISALHQGSVDLAVVTTPTGIKKDLCETRLACFEEILIGGQEFSALAGKPLPFSELTNYPLIMLAKGTMTYAYYSQLFLQEGIVLEADTEVAAADQLLPLALGNLGLAFIPEPLAHQALAHGKAVRIPLEYAPIRRHVVLLKDQCHALGIAGRELEKFLRSEAESYKGMKGDNRQ